MKDKEKKAKEKKKINFKDIFKNVFALVVGNLLFAISVELFIVPANLMPTGITGVALVVNHFTGFSISLFVTLFNIIALILGLIFLGKKFFMTTVVSSILYPIFLEIIERVLPKDFRITDNLILNMIFGGVIMGISLGIVFRAGTSTGGMDVPVVIVSKYCKIPVSISMYIFDFFIISIQAFIHTPDEFLYSLILLFITSFAIDKTSHLGISRMEVKIMSSKNSEICDRILSEIDRGVTLLEARGGFSRQKAYVVMTVMSKRELAKLDKLIHEIDPDSFMIVSEVKDVIGKGFSEEKLYKSRPELMGILNVDENDQEI